MHEETLTENVMSHIAARFAHHPLHPGEEISEVTVTAGALDLPSEESFREAFKAWARGSPLEGCVLRVKLKPGHIHCDDCGFRGECPVGEGDGSEAVPVTECPQCGAVVRIHGGRGVELKTRTLVADFQY